MHPSTDGYTRPLELVGVVNWGEYNAVIPKLTPRVRIRSSIVKNPRLQVLRPQYGMSQQVRFMFSSRISAFGRDYS